MSNNDKFLEFRKQYDTFIYDKYEIVYDEENMNIKYYFNIPGLTWFYPQIRINKKYILNKDINDYIKVGMTEKQIAYEIEKYMREHGADGLAFESIVAAGKNASMPHAVPTDNKVKENDIILKDFDCLDLRNTLLCGQAFRWTEFCLSVLACR